MSTLYTINVTNNSAFTQNFFFFQKPAVYVGGPTVYSNSIYQNALLPYANSGSILTFQFLQQYYAGAQNSVKSLQVGQASGYTTAAQAIDVTTATGTPNNTTVLSASPLGLSKPQYQQGVQEGAFRIITPAFNPTLSPINTGLAIFDPTAGTFVLSNFIQAQPQKNIDAQPIVTFYVATGSYQAGAIINFTTSSIGAALCDATPGYTNFNVSYEIDGSWTVKPSASAPAPAALKFPGLTQLIGASSLPELVAASAPPVLVDILNEAGTGVIAQGTAPNLNLPVTVSNINNPAALQVHREYQLRSGGVTVGVMCTAVNVAAATANFV